MVASGDRADASSPPSEPRCLALADAGTGPLLQRDYWAVIADCARTPAEVAAFVAERFTELAPPALVRFERAPGRAGPLAVGDELAVTIRGAARCAVRVLHRDACSLTLGTLAGHPEAGKITFGAYRHADGGVVFHIRSRARASTPSRLAGYVAVGEAMQTVTWVDFVESVAATLGRGVVGFVYEETTEVPATADDAVASPTFVARER